MEKLLGEGGSPLELNDDVLGMALDCVYSSGRRTITDRLTDRA